MKIANYFQSSRKEKMSRIFGVFSHPIIISTIATAIVIILLPIRFPKATIKVIEFQKLESSGSVVYYDDIDGNGYSDLIVARNNSIGNSGVSLKLLPMHYSQQWNFYGKLDFDNDSFLMTGDYDNDGKKEIFLFTVSNDSIFLNGVSLNQPFIKKRFICKALVVKGRIDATFYRMQMEDLNNDGYKELIFGIMTGFSLYPRNVFAYDIKNDELTSSPKNGFNITGVTQSDLIGDGKKESLFNGYTSENISDSKYKLDYEYSDDKVWLEVLDHRLQFLFPPVMIPDSSGGYETFALKSNSTNKKLFVWAVTLLNKKKVGRLMEFDIKGQKLKEKTLSDFEPDIGAHAFALNDHGEQKICIYTQNGKAFIYDTNFNLQKVNSVPSGSELLCMDIDQDNKDKVIFINYPNNSLSIARNDFSDLVEVNVKLTDQNRTTLTLKRNPVAPPIISLSTGSMSYLIDYHANIYAYYAQWGLNAGIFILILSFTLIVRRIQKHQLQKTFNIERKITELQLMSIKNQLDPDSTYNSINMISASILEDDREQAHQNILRLSKLIRSSIDNADEFFRSLEKELEFVENYLELVKSKKDNSFQFSVEVTPQVDLSWQVPKMIIQVYVENAINYGIIPKKENGKLSIKVSSDDKKLFLVIEDNGVGRQKSIQMGMASQSRGLKAMEQYFELNYKITSQKIDSETIDLYDSDGKPSGTRVCLSISNPIKYFPDSKT